MSRERVPFAPPAFVADALRARTRARAEMTDEEVAHPSSSSSSREMQMQTHAHEDARPPSTDATARDSPRDDDEDESSVSVRARGRRAMTMERTFSIDALNPKCSRLRLRPRYSSIQSNWSKPLSMSFPSFLTTSLKSSRVAFFLA